MDQNAQRIVVNHDLRAPCPVCGGSLWYIHADPGEDVTDIFTVPEHLELSTGRRCYASGTWGPDAVALRAEVVRDPLLPLRAHP